jgi:hypothetical protein
VKLDVSRLLVRPSKSDPRSQKNFKTPLPGYDKACVIRAICELELEVELELELELELEVT